MGTGKKITFPFSEGDIVEIFITVKGHVQREVGVIYQIYGDESAAIMLRNSEIYCRGIAGLQLATDEESFLFKLEMTHEPD